MIFKQIINTTMVFFCSIAIQAQVGGSFFFAGTSPSPTVTALNCAGATTTGIATVSVATSGVSIAVAYTGGNGQAYPAQSVTSTGITGLTASLSAGTLATGAGSVSYTISGTPAGTTFGNANFAISLGGKSCTLALFIDPPNVLNATTNRRWMDRNLGATQVATSLTDTNGYGHYYQWGRGTDGHQISTSATTSTTSATDSPGHGNFILNATDWRSPQNDNLWQGVNGINNPCPTNYRIPTSAEWDAETATWATKNGAGGYGGVLKLPSAGYRNTGGIMSGVGINSYYWSSIVSGVNVTFLNTPTGSQASNSRSFGFSVRCIRN